MNRFVIQQKPIFRVSLNYTNIKIELVTKDYEELSKDDIAPFDLMLMVNCTYYASSLEQLLKGAVHLTGQLIIISTSRHCPSVL